MDQPGSRHSELVRFADVADFVREARRRGRIEEQSEPPPFYRVALGLEAIQLGDVEFRILTLLASRPYLPFSHEAIAGAVSTELHPVTADSVDQHIASLRDQLGFFRDYVQTVPFMGYRFKE
jgi:DNA-binding response OmpR family regulator